MDHIPSTPDRKQPFSMSDSLANNMRTLALARPTSTPNDSVSPRTGTDDEFQSLSLDQLRELYRDNAARLRALNVMNCALTKELADARRAKPEAGKPLETITAPEA